MSLASSSLNVSLYLYRIVKINREADASALEIEIVVSEGIFHRIDRRSTETMAQSQVNEVDELLKDLKKVPGFKAYLVLNSAGIVIRWDQVAGQPMAYPSAVQHGEFGALCHRRHRSVALLV